jgi:hypothetical protein
VVGWAGERGGRTSGGLGGGGGWGGRGGGLEAQAGVEAVGRLVVRVGWWFPRGGGGKGCHARCAHGGCSSMVRTHLARRRAIRISNA